jgi:regulator of protease activity HflC (stomatin/prohibitin superfamily)
LQQVKNIGSRPTAAVQNTIADRRRRLQNRITDFNDKSTTYLRNNISADVGNNNLENILNSIGVLIDFQDDDNPFISDNTLRSTNVDAEVVDAEKQHIQLPSVIVKGGTISEKIQPQVNQEIEIRIGQANDALHELRMTLGYKAMLYRTLVRNATTQQTKTRAFAETKSIEATVRIHVTNYMLARDAMVILMASADVLEKYKPLSKADLKVETVSFDSGIHGIRNSHLPWIWKVGYVTDNNSKWLNECKLLSI